MVEADSGSIGGASSHEFMVLADTGEDAVVRSTTGGYAANVENGRPSARSRRPPAAEPAELQQVSTPGPEDCCRGCGELPRSADRGFRQDPALRDDEDRFRGRSHPWRSRGQRGQAEERISGASICALASEAKVVELTGAPVGFAGPVNLPGELRLVADRDGSTA